MRIFRDTHVRLVEAAVKADPNIQTTLEGLPKASGVTAAYMQELGLPYGLLRRLETWGLAKRGYAPTKRGKVVRWILVKPDGT